MRVVFLGRVNETYLYPESVTENCSESPAGRLPGVSRWSLTWSLSLVVYTPQGGTKKSALKRCLYPVFKGAYLVHMRKDFKSIPLNLSP